MYTFFGKCSEEFNIFCNWEVEKVSKFEVPSIVVIERDMSVTPGFWLLVDTADYVDTPSLIDHTSSLYCNTRVSQHTVRPITTGKLVYYFRQN